MDACVWGGVSPLLKPLWLRAESWESSLPRQQKGLCPLDSQMLRVLWPQGVCRVPDGYWGAWAWTRWGREPAGTPQGGHAPTKEKSLSWHSGASGCSAIGEGGVARMLRGSVNRCIWLQEEEGTQGGRGRDDIWWQGGPAVHICHPPPPHTLFCCSAGLCTGPEDALRVFRGPN